MGWVRQSQVPSISSLLLIKNNTFDKISKVDVYQAPRVSNLATIILNHFITVIQSATMKTTALLCSALVAGASAFGKLYIVYIVWVVDIFGCLLTSLN